MGKAQLIENLHHERFVLRQLQQHDQHQDFLSEVRAGLGATPKTLSPKFFYDEEGSRLFERITEQTEYYPTRKEAEILDAFGGEIIDTTRHGQDFTLVELGSGSSTKTRLLLNELAERQDAISYVPIDISPTIVTEFAERLLQDYPALHITGLICDYHQAMTELKSHPEDNKLFLFLGSSLGNFTPADASALLSDIAAAMGPQDKLLLGLDLIKDEVVLNRAYNDAAGVTAAFNLNLLTRINRELGGEFDLARFRHKAFFNAGQRRVEMHLESLAEQTVRVDALDAAFSFAAGETIHTENSYKFDRAALGELLAGTGLRLVQQWRDGDDWFSLNLVARS
jgi:L-histidine N-alpha-methyltransferase